MKSKLEFLLVPMTPTPNGRMHIGHGGGPYLRCDALARALRREGKEVVVASGSDAYENWVLTAAEDAAMKPEELCTRNHALIAADLRNLDVDFDFWIDPLSDQHNAAMAEAYNAILRELIETNGATLRSEMVPVSANTGRYIFGVWISGSCPQCDQPVNGNSCVRCGASFQPSEIVNARARYEDGAVVWREVKNWFTVPIASELLLDELKKRALPHDVMSIAEQQVARSGTSIRLSQQGEWGMAIDRPDEDVVLCNTFFGYAVYCARFVSMQRQLPKQPLSSGALTKTIAFFGKDNAGSSLIAPVAISLNSNDIRSFDGLNVTGMLYLEGSKCSTSKHYGIWITELLENTSISSDELRFVLSQVPLEDGDADLTLAEMVRTINELRRFVTDRLSEAARRYEHDSCLRLRVSGELGAELNRQQAAFSPGGVRLSLATAILVAWMRRPESSSLIPYERAHWLLGFALLAEPIMPQLAAAVWHLLGGAGRPRLAADLPEKPSSSKNDHFPRKAFTSVAEVRPYAHGVLDL